MEGVERETYVACKGVNAYSNIVLKPDGRSLLGRLVHKWENDIEMC
jgi:hypothetical protein